MEIDICFGKPAARKVTKVEQQKVEPKVEPKVRKPRAKKVAAVAITEQSVKKTRKKKELTPEQKQRLKEREERQRILAEKRALREAKKAELERKRKERASRLAEREKKLAAKEQKKLDKVKYAAMSRADMNYFKGDYEYVKGKGHSAKLMTFWHNTSFMRILCERNGAFLLNYNNDLILYDMITWDAVAIGNIFDKELPDMNNLPWEKLEAASGRSIDEPVAALIPNADNSLLK